VRSVPAKQPKLVSLNTDSNRNVKKIMVEEGGTTTQQVGISEEKVDEGETMEL